MGLCQSRQLSNNSVNNSALVYHHTALVIISSYLDEKDCRGLLYIVNESEFRKILIRRMVEIVKGDIDTCILRMMRLNRINSGIFDQLNAIMHGVFTRENIESLGLPSRNPTLGMASLISLFIQMGFDLIAQHKKKNETSSESIERMERSMKVYAFDFRDQSVIIKMAITLYNRENMTLWSSVLRCASESFEICSEL